MGEGRGEGERLARRGRAAAEREQADRDRGCAPEKALPHTAIIASSVTNLRCAMTEAHTIDLVATADLDDLLPLVRAYCDFYETSPTDAALIELSRALIADPEREGIQLIARDGDARAVGFATVFWSWDTTEGSRIGIMNDLYVAPEARGSGLADRLIMECVERCRMRGASRLEWLTGPENGRAQAVYDRVHGEREPWLVYTLPASVGEASIAT